MDVRQKLLELVAEQQPETDLANLSRALGRNHAYLQQFVKRGVPKKLPEEVRYQLAGLLGVDQSELLESGSGAASSNQEAPGLESPGIPFQHAPKHLLKQRKTHAVSKQGDSYYLAGVIPDSEQSYALEVKDRSMELAGFVPGDVVISELGKKCTEGQYVIVQHYLESGDAETIIREYRAPFLMPRSTDSAFVPIQIADSNIRIVSPVLKKISLY